MLTLVSGPAVEPVSVEEARTHLRIDRTDEDPWLVAAIIAARQRMEGFLGRALIHQVWELSLDRWPGRALELRPAPLASVTSISYTALDGTEATVAGGDYLADTRATPGRIVLRDSASWPGGTLREADAIRVRFTAGYGAEAAAVPQLIRSVMLLWVGDLYEHREATVVGTIATKLPLGLEEALWQYRVF